MQIPKRRSLKATFGGDAVLYLRSDSLGMREDPGRLLEKYFTPPREYAGNYGPYRSPLKFADGALVKSPVNPRTGLYRDLIEAGEDLVDLHALMAPRPLLVSGGTEDPPQNWQALNHLVTVNERLGYKHRVAMHGSIDRIPAGRTVRHAQVSSCGSAQESCLVRPAPTSWARAASPDGPAVRAWPRLFP